METAATPGVETPADKPNCPALALKFETCICDASPSRKEVNCKAKFPEFGGSSTAVATASIAVCGATGENNCALITFAIVRKSLNELIEPGTPFAVFNATLTVPALPLVADKLTSNVTTSPPAKSGVVAKVTLLPVNVVVVLSVRPIWVTPIAPPSD